MVLTSLDSSDCGCLPGIVQPHHHQSHFPVREEIKRISKHDVYTEHLDSEVHRHATGCKVLT